MHSLLRFAGVVVAAVLFAVPTTSLAAGTNQPPTGETLNGDNTGPGPFSSAITCQSLTAGTLTFTISGLALGPYPGTFTESGTVTISGGVVTSFSASFTITSGSTTLTGTKTGPVSSPGSGQCVENPPEFPLGTNFFEAVGFDATYQVTITGPAGTNTFTGPVANSFNFTSGVFPSGGSQEVMGTAAEVPPTPVCQTDDDDDQDGLIDSRESLYSALAGDPDTDHDGIRDGNDDANHNQVADEDEDDDGNDCEADSDHDGNHDEDEDD
jgi:hypothetical protein